jgi:hypothetical protein
VRATGEGHGWRAPYAHIRFTAMLASMAYFTGYATAPSQAVISLCPIDAQLSAEPAVCLSVMCVGGSRPKSVAARGEATVNVQRLRPACLTACPVSRIEVGMVCANDYRALAS